jgi:RNA polymerase sigma factor (sigma-70 family)
MSDDAFLAEQYRLHAATVFRRCLIMGRGDAAWAQDVTHDVFIRLMEHQDALDRSSSLLGWLLTVAYRLCANRLRHERTLWGRVQALLRSSPEPASAEPDPVALGPRLQQALGGLPPQQRAVVVMHYLDGISQTNIAEALGLSEGYVSKLLSRGLQSLRALDWEVDDGAQ